MVRRGRTLHVTYMAKVEADQLLVPSVLDRLIDEEPTATRESPKSRGQLLRDLKQCIRRDLENLLNTRRRCKSCPENLDELELSLVNYGVPDLTSAALGTAEGREEFRRIFESVVQHFEPRFAKVHVAILGNANLLDRTLRFRIDALVHAEPAPEPVVFDSSLQPATGNVKVKGAGR
jgi:type VI secretion system protein ImpF